MNSFLDYVQHLVRPVVVHVVDDNTQLFESIRRALSVYNCLTKHLTVAECLQNVCDANLVFIAADDDAELLTVVDRLEETCPQASLVIFTSRPTSAAVVDLMHTGVYTFLAKTVPCSAAQICQVFRQLNVKLLNKADEPCHA